MPSSAVDLRTNARTCPLGIDTHTPEFAWRISSSASDVVQRAYAIQVATDEAFGPSLVWDSGRVSSELPFGARYDGVDLRSGCRYWWRVRTWCSTGAPGHDKAGSDDGAASSPEGASDWSDPSWFETSVLDPSLWSAQWVTGGRPASKQDDAVVYFRGTARLPAAVVSARAHVSAHGWYRFFVNGQDQTGDALVPRWTPFDRVVEYQTYDITEALRGGTNLLAVAVGDGRFRGGLGLNGGRNSYGDRVAAFVQLEVELSDGSRVTTGTDGDWSAGPGRITGSDPKNGERADLRLTDVDWLTAPESPAHFAPVEVLPHQAAALVAEEVERVRCVARLRPSVRRAPSGAQILDFGQNFTGVVRIRLSGPAGHAVRLTHSELLSPEGELDVDYQQMGKKWYQRESVVLGGAPEWYQPWFTIHGFRYAEVTGLDHDLEPDDAEGVVLSSDLPTAGTFSCSDPRLEQLRSNVEWSLRSNFTDTPTDCPTRERSGWTGDIQVFAPTGAVMVDEQAYLRRYLSNLVLEQYPDGAVPLFIPSERPTTPGWQRRLIHIMSRSAGWADAAVLVPWTLYQYYGDRSVLRRQYESMRLWVDQMERAARRRSLYRRLQQGRLRGRGAVDESFVLDTGFHFGEWLRPGENALTSIARHLVVPPAVIATAYFARSSGVLAAAAGVLGLEADEQRYSRLAADVRTAWCSAFVEDDGRGGVRIGDDRQEDYVRALAFDLLDPPQRPGAAARLAELVTSAGDHLSTGFLSTSMLLGVLVDGGYQDVAMRVLLQTTNPSWLYQVEHGATTVWETWEGYREDGRGKESHNHYALGAVAGWLTEGLAGLAPTAPGYRRFSVQPVVTSHLTRAAATVETPFGTARSAWERRGGTVSLQVTVPPGAEAAVTVPVALGSSEVRLVGSGAHSFQWPERYSTGR